MRLPFNLLRIHNSSQRATKCFEMNILFECCKSVNYHYDKDNVYGEKYIKFCSCWPNRVTVQIEAAPEPFDVYIVKIASLATSSNGSLSGVGGGGNVSIEPNRKHRCVVRRLYRQYDTIRFEVLECELNEAFVVAVNRSLFYTMNEHLAYSTNLDMADRLDSIDHYSLFNRLYKASCYENELNCHMGTHRSFGSKGRLVANLLHSMTSDDHVFDAWPDSPHRLRVNMTVAIERFVNRIRVYTLTPDVIDCALGMDTKCNLHRIMSNRSMELHLRHKSRGTLFGFVRFIEFDFCMNDHYDENLMSNGDFVNVKYIVGQENFNKHVINKIHKML